MGLIIMSISFQEIKEPIVGKRNLFPHVQFLTRDVIMVPEIRTSLVRVPEMGRLLSGFLRWGLPSSASLRWGRLSSGSLRWGRPSSGSLRWGCPCFTVIAGRITVTNYIAPLFFPSFGKYAWDKIL